ncbi:MAG: hypothetical protein B6I36_09910 [Desulfobacteraceae bacterium 4572_35.1]|nr:MAG: hypothetical protein B6I36_09910 [Desulfobacteraceae bacterium 4572_35.1]
MLDWSNYTQADETLIWQGRPAPRCFTFRRWRRALFGILLLIVSCWWQYAGYKLMEQQGTALVWSFVPLPFVALSLHLSIGQLLLARVEWERVFYAMTSRQILVQCGIRRTKIIAIPLNTLCYQCLYPLGEHLGNLYIEADKRRLMLCCIEHPHELYGRLRVIIDKNITAENCEIRH